MNMPSEQSELENFRGSDGRGWICDTCGEIISTAKDGWVEWCNRSVSSTVLSQPTQYGLRLVHRWSASPLPKDREDEFGCQYGENNRAFTVSDSDLPTFLGDDGLMRLLALIHSERLPTEEVLGMIKRLHIANYEHARQHVDAARQQGVFDGNTAAGYERQSELRAVLSWNAEQEIAEGT